MSSLAVLADVATALAVLVGVVFGLLQIVHLRRDRQDRAAFEIIHAMLSPEYVRSIMVVHELPEGVTAADISSRSEVLTCGIAIGLTFETLGYAVFRRVVPLDMAHDIVGGAVRVSWDRLRPYVEDSRTRSGSEKAWEWFQWLAERLAERQPTTAARGAQVEHQHWQP